MSLLDRDLALLVVAQKELGLHVATDCFDGAGGKHALGRATRPHHAVDSVPHLERRLERTANVTCRDELDASADFADLGDDLLVSRPLEHNYCQFLRWQPLRFGDTAQVPLDRHVEIDHSASPPPDHELLHVMHVAGEHRPALGQRDD